MKVVVKLEFAEDKIKQKAMKTVSGLSGVESIALDPKDKKLTVTGNVDTVAVVRKLRKLCPADIVSVEQEKEPEKNKDEPKKGGDTKKEGPNVDPAQLLKGYQEHYRNMYYNQRHYQALYYNRSVEEDPNGCVIC